MQILTSFLKVLIEPLVLLIALLKEILIVVTFMCLMND